MTEHNENEKCGDAEHEAPIAPPDAIALHMGPEVTAWIADVLHQWHNAQVGKRHAESEAAAEKATREYIADQLCECGADRDAARKRLTEVANHVDPSVLASVNAELALSRKALADMLKELVEFQQLAKNREEEVNAWVTKKTTADSLRDRAFAERDAATKRAQIAEAELTKTRQMLWEATMRAEKAETERASTAGVTELVFEKGQLTARLNEARSEKDNALAQVAHLEEVIAAANVNPLTLYGFDTGSRVHSVDANRSFIGLVLDVSGGKAAATEAIKRIASWL